MPAWTAWGRFATAGFEADVDEVRMDGDVTTGFLGADVARARWLARMEDVRAHAGSAVGNRPAASILDGQPFE